MAINYPGPYELRMYYTCSVSGAVLNHVQKMNLDVDGEPDPGTAFADITPVRRIGLTTDLETAVDDWVVLIRAAYPSTAFAISRFELWRIAPDSFDGTFISAYEIGLAGVGAASVFPAGQYIMTFRTLEGGIMRVSFMEHIATAIGITDPPPLAQTGMQAIADFITSTSNYFLGRDTSYPIALRAGFPGQNEVLFKLRYRPNNV